MYNKYLKFITKKTKPILTFFMTILLVLSQVTVAFADAPFPGKFILSQASFNGGNTINANSSGQFDNITSAYQSVPLNTTFTLKFGTIRVFLFRGGWDPVTGGFSSVLNRDLVQIQDMNGNVVNGITVSNANDPENALGTDSTVNISTNNVLDYDTNYKLVLKKYFSKSNQQNPPQIKGAVSEDVVIPFKTEARQKPTLTKAELRGSSLRLEGLPVGQDLQYNLAMDGQFDNSNWRAFSYTDDTANIEVSNTVLTANSKVMVGYSNKDNSAPICVSDPINVLYASTSAPTFTGAVLNVNNLILNGLPKNAVNLEYRISADGQNYSVWKDMTVIGTSSVVSAEGLNLIENQSLIQVRYKASAPWAASEIAEKSFIYGLGNAVPLTQGSETALDDGIKINSVSLNTPEAGEANTVTIRNAKGEKLPAPAGMTSMGFVEENDTVVRSAGGVYGFSLKGAGNGDNNHVKITLPYKLPAERPEGIPDYAVIDDSKVAIFMLTPIQFGNSTELWQYWDMMSTTVDPVNHTATVDITGFDANGKDIVLGVKYYVETPANFFINEYSRTATSLTLNIFQGSSQVGTKEMVLQRVNRDDPTDVKAVTLSHKDYPKLLNFWQDNWIFYTDNDLKPGVNYEYTILSVTDMLGNKSCARDSSTGKVVDNPSPPCYGTIDSMETLVKETQDAIYANLKELQNTPYYQPHIMFASGDSQNSVTQKISLPSRGVFGYGITDIIWTSDRTDIIKISEKGGDTEVHPPIDKDGNPIKDGVTVTLTGTITHSTYIDGITHERETATGTVTVPLKVKWNISSGEATIGSEFMHNPNMGRDYKINTDPTVDINTAAKFDDSIVKTIVLQHSLTLSDKTIWEGNSVTSAAADYVLDANGKTIKAGFDGALFKSMQSNSGSFTLKNAVIDMNHKAGPILSAQSIGTKIIFDNVKIINAENCDYGILLEASASGNGSFTASNCKFPSFKVAAINASTPAYSYSSTILDKTYTTNYVPTPVSIDNCTFDGENRAGYGVLNAFGKISIKNSTFKGYKGNVNTGWNTSNDIYDLPNMSKNPLDGDGNTYFPYKGIPDGSPSAAILVKEQGSLDLSGNAITDSDNSVLAWIGEKNFSFLFRKPGAGFVTYPTINGTKVDSTTTGQVVDNVLAGNTIVGIGDGNQLVVQDAADRYNRTTLLAKASGQIAEGIKFEAADNSIELGAEKVTKSIKAVALDQNSDEIKSQNIHWSVEGSPIGVTVSDTGVLTVQPYASLGNISVKASISGTDISNTKSFAIKVPVLQTAMNLEAVKESVTKAKEANSIDLQKSSDQIVAVDSASLQEINAVNKPMLLTSAADVKFLLKPADLKLGTSNLGDVQQLQMSSTAVDETTKKQLNSTNTLSSLSGGNFSLATTPFKLSAVAVLNDGDQQQITNFNNAITVTLPAPSEIKLEANQTLRACRFNTETGVWEDRGEASLNDGYITFNTTGFSYWTVMVKTLNNTVSEPAAGDNSTANNTTNSNVVTAEANNGSNTNVTAVETTNNSSNTNVVAAQATNNSTTSTNDNSSNNVVATAANTSNTTSTSNATTSNTATTDSATSTNNANSTTKAAETNNSVKAADKSTTGTSSNKAVNEAKTSTKQVSFITWVLAALGLLLIIRIAVVIIAKRNRKNRAII